MKNIKYKDLKNYIENEIKKDLNIVLNIQTIDMKNSNIKILNSTIQTLESKAMRLNILLHDLLHLGLRQSRYIKMNEYNGNKNTIPVENIKLHSFEQIETTIDAIDGKTRYYWYVVDLSIFEDVNIFTRKVLAAIEDSKRYFFDNISKELHRNHKFYNEINWYVRSMEDINRMNLTEAYKNKSVDIEYLIISDLTYSNIYNDQLDKYNKIDLAITEQI